MTLNNLITVDKDGIPFINSIKLAEAFNKRPSTIHKEIEEYTGNEESRNKMFVKSKYIDKKGVEQQCYNITMMGFGSIAPIFRRKEDHLLIQDILKSYRKYDKSGRTTIWEYEQQIKETTRLIAALRREIRR